MSKVETLRAFVNQRLTAAAEEIFELFERTIAEYEEEDERKRKLLEAVLNPEVRLHRADIQQLLVVKEEVPLEQQEWSSSLDQEDPEAPHIKEEQEVLWTSQEGEQLQGLREADNKFPFTSVTVKSEEDDGEEAQSSQLHETEENRVVERTDGEDCGGSEPARNSDPDSDDSRDWEETKEPQSGLHPLQNNEVPVSDIECNTGKTSVSSSECVRIFGNNLQNHTGIYTGEKPFSCSLCGERFPRRKSLMVHMRLHSDGKCFSCSVCKTSFDASSKLVQHMRTHTGEKPFSCSVCSKRFAVHGNLTRHLNFHTGKKPFSCSVCSKTFTQKADLRRHLTVHTGEKQFSCLVCGKRFSDDSNLKRHLIVHTGEKPYSCSACGKRFARNEHLKQHLVLHSGEKPFSCSVCDKRFTRLFNVKKHKCVGESNTNK